MRLFFTLLLIFPTLIFAQSFQREASSIPIENYERLLPAPFTGGFNNSIPCLVDIDADSDLDLFIGNRTGKIYYFRNDGSPQSALFTFITDFFDSIYFNPYYCDDPKINFCDIDSDGDIDLFIAETVSIDTSRIYFYKNNGTSEFYDFVLEDTGFANIYYISNIYPEFCDIDNDSDFDLIIGHAETQYLGHMSFYRNIGTSQMPQYQFITHNFSNINVNGVAHPRFCDINNEGDFDLFVGVGSTFGITPDTANGRIFYYENVGTPEVYDFNLISTFYDSIYVQDEASPCFADIDADGDYDLFVGKGDDVPYFGTGNMGGDLVFYQNNGNQTNPSFDFITKNYFGIDVGISSCPKFCDIDADGDWDMFISHSANHIVFYRNEGDSYNPYFVLEDEQYQDIEVNYGVSIDFTDIDADGDFDLFISSGAFGEQLISLYLNQGTPLEADFQLDTFDLVGTIESANPCLIDIDNDNDFDLFVGYSDSPSSSVKFFENVGNSSEYRFQLITSNYSNITTNNLDVPKIDFTDIDNDVDYDLFLSCVGGASPVYYHRIRKYTNTGNPWNANFVLTDTSFADIFINGNYFDFCDIDGDGDKDLFLGDFNGGVVFFRNLQNNSVSYRDTPHPIAFSLLPCYPNPFNPTTTINFTVGKALPMQLKVYNQLGQQVITIINNQMVPGNYQVNWDASQFSSGVYLISLESNAGIQQTQKAILIK